MAVLRVTGGGHESNWGGPQRIPTFSDFLKSYRRFSFGTGGRGIVLPDEMPQTPNVVRTSTSPRALATLVAQLNVACRSCLALTALVALAFGLAPARADVTEAWVHRYNNVVSNSVDQAVKVVRDGAGDIIVTGSTDDGVTGQDMLTIKYSGANGSVLWQKRYNSPANGDDQALALAVDNNGNVVVSGTSNYDYYTAKYAGADGALLWEKRYNGPADSDDQAFGLAVDGSGNVVVTGTSDNTNWTGPDYYTAKYAAADGALLWEKRYNGPANSDDYASGLAVDGSGNVVVTGTSYNGAEFGGSYDYYTAQYAAADGLLLWEQRYDGPASVYGSRPDSAQAVALDSNGNVVVTGVSGWATLGGSKIGSYTVKYAAADGAPLWEQSYDLSTTEDYFHMAPPVAVTVDSGGGVVVTAHPYGIENRYDFYTAKYAAADGALLWEQSYNGPANREDNAQAVSVDSGGNVVVTGSSRSAAGNDFYTAKYAAVSGTLLWEKRHSGSAYYGEGAKALSLDARGNVVVTGAAQGNFYTAKYASADGALLWEQRLSDGPGIFGGARAVAVDGNGDVVVMGSSRGNIYTAKYASADGALLWEKRYNGPANLPDYAYAMAVDGAGNVVVTGSSVGSEGIPGYYTAKYASANGALLWEKRYNGPANTGGAAQAVAIDQSGNVIVTGYSHNGAFGYDCYTAKYAAGDGTLLWENRHNGSAYFGGSAKAMALDARGNVVVTTSSVGSGTDWNYDTARYAAADGALLWEKRYSGLANGYNYASSVALGPDGTVAVTGSSGGDYATVVYWENLPPISIGKAPTGLHLRFTGVPGSTYNIQRAPSVTGLWTTVHTQITSASGLIEYDDPPPRPGPVFYRTVQP